MQDADDLANGVIRKKICCDDFRGAAEWRQIEWHVIPRKWVITFDKVNQDCGLYGSKQESITYCPFCGAKL